MKKLTVSLSDGQKILLAIPDDAELHYEKAALTTAKQNPAVQQAKEETVRQKLYNELKAFCDGDKEEMERVMTKVSNWKGYTKSVADIPKLTDGRAGACLKKLRELVANPPAEPEPEMSDNDEDWPF